jgi:hypothetical protein
MYVMVLEHICLKIMPIINCVLKIANIFKKNLKLFKTFMKFVITIPHVILDTLNHVKSLIIFISQMGVF